MAPTRCYDLEEEPLKLILNSLTDFFDLLSCRGVCLKWRSMAKKLCHQDMVTPLLFYPVKAIMSEDYGKMLSANKSAAGFFAPKRCLSSYSGWLLKNDPVFGAFLYNPLSGKQVLLPPLPARDYPTPLRFLTSCSPDDHRNCVVLVLYILGGSHQGCICKPGDGDNKWTEVLDAEGWYDDMIYYKGDLHGIDKNGSLHQLKSDNCGLQVKRVAAKEATARGRFDGARYLVESFAGELLMVVRRFGIVTEKKTKGLAVFRLDWRKGVWEEVREFGGDEALLLAYNDSMFVPVGSVYRRNCIYFVDDSWVGGGINHWGDYDYEVQPSHDYGVYNLGNGIIESFKQPPPIVDAALFYRWFRL